MDVHESILRYDLGDWFSSRVSSMSDSVPVV
jgi:hypothetical protein